MTSRTDLLDLIDRALIDHLGSEKVTRRPDGVIVAAGSSEAFLIQALLVDAPEGADAARFGEDLIKFIRGGGEANADGIVPERAGEVFYESENGDRWLLVTHEDGRQLIRHVPNRPSGGAVEFLDFQTFLNLEPHSPQNRALAGLLRRT